MAAVTRVNGTGHVDATLYSTANLACYTCTLAGGAPSTGIGGLLERVAQESGALMFEADGDGIVMIVDGHAATADSLAERIGAVTGATETVTLQTTLLALAP
jgi:hypothetical protein